MHPLVFECPNTGAQLDTGLDITVHHRALQSMQPITLQLICPLCGKQHVWKLADGWLCEPRRGEITGAWRPM
jgi:predicted RNA-binding Zn-ribbon protein involved in translation (DUF1610 family)